MNKTINTSAPMTAGVVARLSDPQGVGRCEPGVQDRATFVMSTAFSYRGTVARGAGRQRHGVTIVEVLFAIGVILIGLVGVVAIIPVAGRDAGEALRIDAANRIASGVMDELVARDLKSMTGLVYWDNDPLADDYSVSGQVLGTGSVNDVVSLTSPGMRSVSALLEGPTLSISGTATRLKGLDSPGFAYKFQSSGSTPGYRTTRMASFCLDPDFLSKNDPSTSTLGTTRNAYQISRFPYYSEWYSPLTSPTASIDTSSLGLPHPRMFRITASGTGGFTPSLIADVLTHVDSSMMAYRPEDKSLQPSQVLNNLDAAGTTAGSRRTGGRYTWLATISPPIDGSLSYNVTVVVIESRGGTTDIAGAGGTADTNPTSERVLWVTNGISFGSTAQVTVYGSNAIDDSIRAGEWVMLSQQAYNSSGTPSGTMPAVHRWFRVQRVTEVEKGPFGTGDNILPYTSLTDVWRRDVVLEGPSWQFGSVNNGTVTPAALAVADDSYMTVIDGAVSIREATIVIDP
ncbi:hypothetical protein FF011L_21740 [Roseimaritima multifibrata]|uniref:Uncharacterized protein n=1 Tax=Roseimaritima multifibrata TaxID=1930274 RepID=A0A517MEU3_9BACT|nr:hypothetical protein [Roseimaritima multifibrata]QDS93404.1 hypothetical protein FF011L_21740 [Roseimaritima multifibrata]